MSRQLQGSLPLYVKYNIAYLILHNLFVRLNILSSSIYRVNDHLIYSILILLMYHSETFGGALWFIPMLFLRQRPFRHWFSMGTQIPFFPVCTLLRLFNYCTDRFVY